ncbi:MAG: signal peptidase [Acidimicrobiales bacterium]|nr:signal peptidase [Acidimicrobiales bacterium]
MSSDDSTGTNDDGVEPSADVPPSDDLVIPSTVEAAAPTTAELVDDNAPVTVVNAPVAQKSAVGKSIREWGLVVIIAIAAAVLMKLFVVQQFYVSGESMDYTLHNFDRVLVNKLSYDLHDPNRGDVVVLEEAQGLAPRDLIKRVIGLPGETIEMRDCVVYINGKVLVEPYLDPNVVTAGNCGPNFSQLTVLKDHVFVMGDNRPGSGDSRGTLGQVDYEQIVGRAFVVIWPKSHWKWL